MNYAILVSLLALGIFAGIVACLEVGRRLGRRRLELEGEDSRAGMGAIDGAVFGLMGLLIAFTFSGAANRFDSRRQLIIEETNAIGTAYLRLDLLPVDKRESLREQFRKYVDLRLETYRKLPDIAAVKAELARTTDMQREIWTAAVAASKSESSQTPSILLLPALNQMIDITTTRLMVAYMHPPIIVFVMLVILALLCGLLAGYGMVGGRTRDWPHIIGFALILAMTVFVILDIEYPRLGLIRVEDFDRSLVSLRENMR